MKWMKVAKTHRFERPDADGRCILCGKVQAAEVHRQKTFSGEAFGFALLLIGVGLVLGMATNPDKLLGAMVMMVLIAAIIGSSWNERSEPEVKRTPEESREWILGWHRKQEKERKDQESG